MSKDFGDAKEQSQKNRLHSSGGISYKYHNARSSLQFSELFGSSEDVWKSSSKYIDPGNGYERDWRSSRGRVKGGGDSHFPRAGAPLALDDNWRSSIRCIDPGRDSLSSEGWRSSINVNQSKCGREEDLQWRPSIRVFKLSENCIDRKVKYGRRHVTAVSHDEPFWHTSRGSGKPPPSKWSPPFRNMISTSINTRDLRRKVPSYTKKHPRVQLFPETLDVAIERMNPMKPNNKELRGKVPNYTKKHPHLQLFPETLDITSEGPGPGHFPTPHMREIRARVAEYFKLHPPLHLFSTSLPKQERGGRKDESNGDSCHTIGRQYIPEGHNDHFENPACVTKSSTVPPFHSAKMWCAMGAQRDSAVCRNVITGQIGPNDDCKPPKVTVGPGLLAPAANYNKDIIYSRFSLESVFAPEIPH